MEDRSIDDWSTMGDDENRGKFPVSMDPQEIEESRENPRIACEHEAIGFRSMHGCKTTQQTDI